MASSTSIWQEKIYHALVGVDDYLQSIIDSLNSLDNISDKLDYLQSIDSSLSVISNLADSIYNLSLSMDSSLSSINLHQDHISDTLDLVKTSVDSINTKIDSVNGYLSNIQSNTGAIITPINNIKLNSDALLTNSTFMKNDLNVIRNYIDDIAHATGASATFDEQIATNTLDTYNKVVTIASDTTDIRTNMLLIVDLLQQINGKI